jgi:hypothetical protein
MSLEELDNLDTPPINTVDDFEAALTSTPVAIEDVAVVPDQVESEEGRIPSCTSHRTW